MTETQQITELYSDAATRFNGKKGQQKAYVCITDADGNVLIDRFIGDKSNIEAEGWALAGALKYLYTHDQQGVVKTDSQFWTRILSGEYQLSKEHLFLVRDRIQHFLSLGHSTVLWIPREENKAGWYLEKTYESTWPEYGWWKKKKK